MLRTSIMSIVDFATFFGMKIQGNDIPQIPTDKPIIIEANRATQTVIF